MNQYIFTTDELLAIFSPSTLASLIQDIRDTLCRDPTEKQTDFADRCEAELIALVGPTDAAGMIGDNGKPDDDDIEETCYLCHAATTTLDRAPEDGWFPHYYAGEMEIDELICPDCIKSRCHVDDNGEVCLNGTQEYQPEPF